MGRCFLVVLAIVWTNNLAASGATTMPSVPSSRPGSLPATAANGRATVPREMQELIDKGTKVDGLHIKIRTTMEGDGEPAVVRSPEPRPAQPASAPAVSPDTRPAKRRSHQNDVEVWLDRKQQKMLVVQGGDTHFLVLGPDVYEVTPSVYRGDPVMYGHFRKVPAPVSSKSIGWAGASIRAYVGEDWISRLPMGTSFQPALPPDDLGKTHPGLRWFRADTGGTPQPQPDAMLVGLSPQTGLVEVVRMRHGAGREMLSEVIVSEIGPVKPEAFRLPAALKGTQYCENYHSDEPKRYRELPGDAYRDTDK